MWARWCVCDLGCVCVRVCGCVWGRLVRVARDGQVGVPRLPCVPKGGGVLWQLLLHDVARAGAAAPPGWAPRAVLQSHYWRLKGRGVRPETLERSALVITRCGTRRCAQCNPCVGATSPSLRVVIGCGCGGMLGLVPGTSVLASLQPVVCGSPCSSIAELGSWVCSCPPINANRLTHAVMEALATNCDTSRHS